MEEQELAERCKNGDNVARKVLYETYADRLFGLCIRYMGNRDTAQDVLHDGFIRIFQSFHLFTWRGTGSLRAWMERVIINESLQQIKRSKIMENQIPIEDASEVYDMPAPDDVSQIPEKILMRFIGELPDGYRTVFNLYVFEKKSHKEIAEMLHMNEKSSSSQLFRAKMQLAKKINEWMKDNE
jgi:RNA polymerase sigma-70 factor (ECF subfamily)